jgi:hypothetical protein
MMVIWKRAVKSTVSLLKGTYGILVMHSDHPDLIIGARNGSPMVLGLGDGEMFIASDVSAMIAHTKQVVYFEDGEVVSSGPACPFGHRHAKPPGRQESGQHFLGTRSNGEGKLSLLHAQRNPRAGGFDPSGHERPY